MPASLLKQAAVVKDRVEAPASLQVHEELLAAFPSKSCLLEWQREARS